jgi:hypothetical protein
MNTKILYAGLTYRWEGNIIMDFREAVFVENFIELTGDGI